jgi:hypothetical protein
VSPDDSGAVEVNRLLKPIQEQLNKNCESTSNPVVFIIGPPRSGTTLLSQLLSSTERFGYISNFISRFWEAPAVGVKLQKMVLIEADMNIHFESSYGVTQGLLQPHEFGFFWDRWFDFESESHNLNQKELDKINCQKLIAEISSLETEFGLPLLFKNNTWCTFQADFLAKIFPKAHFLVCDRDPLFIAQSLYLGRINRTGNNKNWWSVKPSNYKSISKLPLWDQVVTQAIDIQQEMDASLNFIDNKRITRIAYCDLCLKPLALVRDILNVIFSDSNISSRAIKQLDRKFKCKDFPQIGQSDWRELNASYQNKMNSRS